MPQPSSAAARSAKRTWLRHISDQRQFDRELAKILRDAAAQAERLLLATIGDNVSAAVRRAQLKTAISQLTQLSNEMWGGRITPAMTAAARTATELGIEGVLELDSILFRAVGDTGLRDSLIQSATRSADHIRSRLLNDIKLSDNVYRTQALANNWVAREINRGIALNLSARQIAANVTRMIKPGTPGGVSFAARRLARTELNNAFHTTTIRAAADDPWTEGFKWNLSGSHPRPDPCDDLAEQDSYDLGVGVFPPKAVPGKPHPQCLCYLTVVQTDDDEFIDNLVAGKYNTWLDRNQ